MWKYACEDARKNANPTRYGNVYTQGALDLIGTVREITEMHLMYHIDEKTGNRVYTLKKVDPNHQATVSAHPARFSPDDKFSKQRIKCKRRFNLLPTQQPRDGL